MPHHQTNSYGIQRGSVQHKVLRVLEACELSCADSLAVAGDPERFTPRRWNLEVLGPLREAGMLEWERATNTWGTTEHGSALARRLGPLDGEVVAAGPAPAAKHNGDDSLLRSCGPRRYFGLLAQRPPVLRPGSEDAARLPSRMGDRLHWPDGRVTACNDITTRSKGAPCTK